MEITLRKLLSMSLCRIVVQLPDRPGSLGLVTTLLGRLGVDIHQMLVLERDGAHAVDEFIAMVPGAVVYRSLAELLREIHGVNVVELEPYDSAGPEALDAALANALPAPALPAPALTARVRRP